MKRTLIIFALIFSAFLACGVLYLVLPLRTLRQLQDRYDQTQRGMTVEQVQALMDHPVAKPSPSWIPTWDDKPLPTEEGRRITSAFHYRVPTFPQPVSFEFTFDKDQRLVGRHIYD